MTVTQIAQHLAALQRTLTVQVPLGTTPVETYQSLTVYAYDSPPRNAVPEANCPAFVNVPGNSQWLPQGSDDSAAAYDQTDWELELLVTHSIEESPEAISAMCFPFIDPVVDLLVSHTNLNQVVNVIRTTYLGDSGIRQIKYGGDTYIGIVFRLRTSEWRLVPYADNE